MIRVLTVVAVVLAVGLHSAGAQQTAPTTRRGGQARGGATPAPIRAKAEELSVIKAKTDQLSALVKQLKGASAKPELVTDVEIYAHAGRMLLEYPDMFANQAAIDHAYKSL